ncbi:MAG: Rieske (2Fe-2S) protein, partial [Caulobacterales bacterium]|nr:Rieske (2Fe-2S) protein [Caulobacterales bacterium]
MGAPTQGRGTKFVPQGVGGYDENWYPVCLSSEVGEGGLFGAPFLSGRVVVFRDSGGAPSVMSAFCRHLGVDLALGKVTEDTLECPYHHWRYDRAGRCVATAVGDEPPRNAKLFKFPTAESLGLIWAYNGLEPAYDTPHLAAAEDTLEIFTERSVTPSIDPFVIYSNTMDLQHLISLHGIKFDKFPEHFDVQERSIAYEQEMILPGLGPSVQQVRLFGTNCIALSNELMGRPTYMMSAGLCVKGPKTLTFNVSATPKSTGKPGEEQMIEQHLTMVSNFGRQLNEEDGPVMETISPRIDNMSASDRALKIYFEYAR